MDSSRCVRNSTSPAKASQRASTLFGKSFTASPFARNATLRWRKLQTDLDGWLREYHEERAHSGKYCFGKTPWRTFHDSAHLAQEKMLDRLTTAAASDIGRQRAEPELERSHAERSGGAGGARVNAA